jgi:hypothetical protein
MSGEVKKLECVCEWLNFLDAMMTVHALTRGKFVEMNLLMREAWGVSPLVYACLKFWLFLAGLYALRQADLKPKDHEMALTIVGGVLVGIFLWHMTIRIFFC